MSLQPKTCKYRVSFRNKTYKKAHILASRDCVATFSPKGEKTKATGFANKYWHSENNATFKDSQSYRPCNYNYPAQYKINFTDSASFITTKNKSIQRSYNRDDKHSLVSNFRALKCLSFVKTESILISNHKDSSNTYPASQEKIISSGTFTSATIDKIQFGQCGLYFGSTGTITAKFIETVRLTISRKLKKAGRFWIRVCPDTPVTARSAETRMGRGKGAINHYEAKVKAGQMFIEFCGVPQNSINQIYLGLLKKSPIKLKLIA